MYSKINFIAHVMWKYEGDKESISHHLDPDGMYIHAHFVTNNVHIASMQLHMITINKCDSLSDNQPGLHLPVFQEIATILKIRSEKTSLTLVLALFT